MKPTISRAANLVHGTGRRGLIACIAGLLAGTSMVGAQTVDHGALEALFGEPVTTSVTGSPLRASEVPATMEIITAEEIRRSGARDLPGLLEHVVGVDALQWGRDNTDLAIRGSNQALSPRLLVLVDGREVYAHFYGFTPWPAIPVELAAIRQIEVVKGPQTALFGFNAVSGAINIITYHPRTDDVDAVSISVGSQDLRQGSAVATFGLGEAADVRLSMGGRRNDDFSTAQDSTDAGSRRGNEMLNAAARAAISLGERVELTLAATHSQAEQPNVIPTYIVTHEDFHNSSAEAALTVDTGWGLVRGRLYHNWFEILSDTSGVLGELLRYDNDVTVGQIETLFKAGSDHTLRIAGEFRHNTIDTTPVGGAQVFYDVASLSGMWHWTVTDSVSWSNAVRIDRRDLGRTGLEPLRYAYRNVDWNQRLTETSFNSGLVWATDNAGTWRLTLGRGVQLPNLSALGATLIDFPDGIGGSPPFVVGGTPYIDPMTVLHAELGWTRDLPGVGGRLSIAAFTSRWADVFMGVGEPPPGGTPNMGDSRTSGLELSLKGASERPGGSRWDWGLSYVPLQVDDEFLPGYVPSSSLVAYEQTTARHTVDVRLGWSRGPWELDGFLKYKSRFRGFDGRPGRTADLLDIPAYFKLDGRVAYRFSDMLVFAVSGQNLLHAEQHQTSASAVERGVVASLDFAF